MRHRVHAEDGLLEVAELWNAATAEDLHRVLVLHPPVRRSADAHEPFSLLAKHHETQPATSVVSATLLLTDPRWRDGVGRLAQQIEGSGILDVEQLDLLAQWFLVADGAVYWAVPDGWFSEDGITLDVGEAGSAIDEIHEDSEGPAVASREVFPPLRRWAAEWTTRRDPSSWGPLLARARDIDARSAAAIMLGTLDAADRLTEPARKLLIAEAVRWPDHMVRRRGYTLVAEREGPDAAYARAKQDPNARTRAFAEHFIKPVIAEPPDANGDRERRPTRQVDAQQQTLF